jgi:hypothetical protein
MPTKKPNPVYLYLVCALLISGVAGCDGFIDLFDNRDKHFPLEDKYKIKFNKGDTLTYTDQFGATFQLVITEIKYDQRWTSRKGSSGPYNIIDRQTVFYDSANVIPPTPPLPGGNIYTQHPDGHVIWEPRLYTIVGEGYPNYYENITINSKVYTSVFKIMGESGAPGFITTWYYTYAYGFVGFERSNGQRFTLKIP